MKKIFFLLSLVFILAWIISVFFVNGPSLVHIFLFGSVLLYIQSVIMIETPGNRSLSTDENLA